MPTNLVLVHGAWGSPKMWDRVTDALSARGIDASTADLPTMCRADATFADDVAHVRDLAGDGPVVLCGHSYGGHVVTEAGAGVEGLVGLVYLASFMTDVGETVFEWSLKRPDPDAEPLDFRDDGTSIPTAWELDPSQGYDDAALALWDEIPPRPFAVSAVLAPVTSTPWRTVPSTYVVATRDITVHPDSQREMAQRATSVVEWEIGHMVNLGKPEEVADLLAGVVGTADS